jgi:hypothetical protein
MTESLGGIIERLGASAAERAMQRYGLDYITAKVTAVDATNYLLDALVGGETVTTTKIPYDPGIQPQITEDVVLALQASGDYFAFARVSLPSRVKPSDQGAESQLGGDVTITNANQYYDGPSLSLGIGTWLVIVALTVSCSGAGEIGYARIVSGGSNVASGEQVAGGAGALTITLVKRLVLVGTTTVKGQAASSSAARAIKAQQTANASGNTASTITAIRLI